MKKLVYICAPLGGSPGVIRQNIKNARLYTRFAVKSGVAPLTPHFLALCLDDNPLHCRFDIGGAFGKVRMAHPCGNHAVLCVFDDPQGRDHHT